MSDQTQTDTNTETALVATATGEATSLFPVLARTPSEFLEEITEALGGEEISPVILDTVSVPGGGGTTYTLPGLDEEGNEVEYFDGIIIAAQPSRAYWAQAYNGEVNQPDCSSPDGRVGVGLFQYGSPENPTGQCASCPMSQFVNGQRPQCKSKMNVYMLLQGRMFPIHMSLAISSIGSGKSPNPTTWKGYHRLLLNYRKSPTAVVTRVGIRHEYFGGGGKNKGTPYAIATFKVSPVELTAEEAARAKAYAELLRPYLLMPSPVITDEATGDIVDASPTTARAF